MADIESLTAEIEVEVKAALGDDVSVRVRRRTNNMVAGVWGPTRFATCYIDPALPPTANAAKLIERYRKAIG